jgi:hypothetical protein
VELSGISCTQISRWLSMSRLVQGLKASMFGANEGNSVSSLVLMLAAATVSLRVAAFFSGLDCRLQRRISQALDL